MSRVPTTLVHGIGKRVKFLIKSHTGVLIDRKPILTQISLRHGSSASQNYPRPGPLSYLSVPGSEPLSSYTVGDLLDQAAARYGDKEAVVFCVPTEVRKTFQELKKDVDSVAAGLLHLGFKKGDRLGIWGPNSYEWYLTHKGGMKAGIVIVNINPAYQTREIAYCIQKVGMQGIIISDVFKKSNYYQMMTEVIPEIERSDPGQTKSASHPTFSTLISMKNSNDLSGAFPFQEVMDKGRGPEAISSLKKAHSLVQFDDVCNIQFTSGTTGNPKGVMLSHHNIINNAIGVSKRFAFDEKDKLCLPVPLFHCFGSVVGTFSALVRGATVVYPSPAFSPLHIIQSIEREKCTVIYGTPTMHIDVINHSEFKNFNMSSLRLAVTAGSICPEELIKQMKNDYTVESVGSCYGMTETSPVSYQSLPNDTEKLQAETVGYPSENVEIKIVDKAGLTVPVGVDGELCVRGYMNMLGYWEDIEKTKETVDMARWLKTGDLAMMLPSGHCRIVGRLKDLVIRGGENIYPREIEDFLHSHPDIQEVHVFGVPDLRMGEEVVAWVHVKDGRTLNEDGLRQFCKGKIAHYKVPRYIVFSSEFPAEKTTSGKVQKFKMREATIKKFNIQDTHLKHSVV